MGDPRRAAARDNRLDVARGLAIIAMVLTHVARGLHSSGLMNLELSSIIVCWGSLWSVSVFSFVSGVFAPRGAEKQGVVHYVRDRATHFMLVYVIWTFLQGAIQLLTATLVNTPTSVSQILSLWHPNSQLWYLPFMAVVIAVFVPMQPWKGRYGWWILAGSAVLSVAFWGYDGGYIGTQGIGLAVFFVAGMVVGSRRVKGALDRFSPALAGVLSIVMLVVTTLIVIATVPTPPTTFWDGRSLATVAIGVSLSVVMSAAIMLFAHAFSSWSVMAMLGRRSLDIYLAHIILIAGTRIVLVHLGVTAIWPLVICSLAVGVIGSIVVANGIRRLRLGWVFDGPDLFAKKPVASRRA